MTYGRHPYGGVGYAASDVADIPDTQTQTTLAVEVAFTTGALETPVWVDVTSDVRSWDVQRGRNRELERFQPGRATVVLGNLSRQYDSVYESGPYFGNIKPMRRIRVRETFNGVTYPVFDGFVDRWQLNYPLTGKDGAATVTATDAFKVLARTDLPVSVYDDAVRADGPTLYWRLDEASNSTSDAAIVALNRGSLGTTGNAAYRGPPALGGEALVVGDPGSSMESRSTNAASGVPVMGARIENASFDLLSTSFVVEAWCFPTRVGTSDMFLWEADAPADVTRGLVRLTSTSVMAFDLGTPTDTQVIASGVVPIHKRYYLVAKYVASTGAMQFWMNGVSQGTATLGGTLTLGAPLTVSAAAPANNWDGLISHVAVYTGANATVVDQTWIDRHYTAGTAPWNGDLPGARLDRVLDIADWPSTAREIDDGVTTLQSVTFDKGVLEHSQKVAESEFGLLFIDRAGNVRFVDKVGLAARTVGPDVYGDETGEIGYRDLVPDDGDQTIRNRATISRLNGVAKVAEDTGSVDEFGRFDYTLDGLLHQQDAWSEQYAEQILFEYHDPRRRVSSLVLGPASPDDAATLYPAMLGHELGDYITVRHRPPGGGAMFTQACVIEGIRHAGTPKMRTATWTLSPAPAGVDPVPLGLLQAEDGDTLETETGDELELDA